MKPNQDELRAWTAIPTVAPLPSTQQSRLRVELLEGACIQPAPPEVHSQQALSLSGSEGQLALSSQDLTRHLLFLGAIGRGKTNAMMQLVAALRRQATADDVFVVFDTKGDYLAEFFQWEAGDRVIANSRDSFQGHVIWNIFEDVLAGTAAARSDEILELSGTIFDEQMSAAGENLFFSIAARDLFSAVLEAVSRGPGRHDNAELRRRCEGSAKELWDLITSYADLSGARHYLAGGGSGTTARAVMAFMSQAVKTAFSGVFREAGDFSVRRFLRAKGGSALFIEYDIAAGSLLLPIYRILIDLALKEAMGRGRPVGNVYVVMDEFSLLPRLRHVADAINFGRGLGLRFLVGTQNVGQIYHAYGDDIGRSVLSGFGTVFAFRLFDDKSRVFVKERHGANRKMITTEHTGRAVGVERNVVVGQVIEDWNLSDLKIGQAIVSISDGEPFFFPFDRYRPGDSDGD